MDEIIKSIESTKPATAYQKKRWDQVITHIKNPKSANLQFVFVAATGDLDKGVRDQSKLFPPADPSAPNGATFAVCLQYPVARGYVHIKSSDPTTPPDINPNYMGHPADVAVLAAGVKFAEKLVRSPALEGKMGKRLHPPTKFDLSTIQGRREATQEYCMGE